jgi:hypothetical protein
MAVGSRRLLDEPKRVLACLVAHGCERREMWERTRRSSTPSARLQPQAYEARGATAGMDNDEARS